MAGITIWRALGCAWVLLILSGVAHAAVPAAPTNLVATAVSGSQINLSWTDKSSNELAFFIERKTGSGSFTGVGRVDPNITNFSDAGLTSATTYTYRVQASNGSGNSAYSNLASATTSGPDITPPTAPTALKATAVSQSQVNLTWTASTDNVAVAGYRVFRTGHSWPTGCSTTATQIASPTGTSFSDTGIAPRTAYCYFVSAVDAAGNVSVGSNLAAAPIDATAPTAPTGLTATAVSSSQVNLSWTASTDNWAVQAYAVLRDSVVLGYPTGTSFSDAGLTPATTYTYFVYAIDTSGNESLTHSNSASATTSASDTTAPSAPAGLTASATSSSQINLSWTASTDSIGVIGYQVDRCQGAGCTTFVQVATPTGTTFNDVGLAPSTSYSYQARATDAAGNVSANSNLASATTQAPPDTTAPTAPTGLTATAASTTQINLTWAASADDVGVTSYRVERCLGTSCTNFVEIAAPAATSFSDTGLTAETSYSYRVRATDAAGNLSGYSNVASGTTGTGQTQAYYILADHLNTPRMIADSAGTTVWRWDQGEPFGNDAPNNNPSGAGAFDFPLRLPGQYFDRETNLAYNTFRDYDSSTGRYVQSDPVGLRGGINTYGYVHGMPVRLTDPMGLANCIFKHVYGDPFDIEEYDPFENRVRIPGVDNNELVKCLSMPGPHQYPTSIEIWVCILVSIDLHGSPATLVTMYNKVFLQNERTWRTEKWCEEGCPPKLVNKGIVGGGIEKLGPRRYIRTDLVGRRLEPSSSGGGDPNPFDQ